MDATARPPARRAPPPAARPQEIRLEGVSKVYADGTVGVAELDLTFAAGELTVLVGPSGLRQDDDDEDDQPDHRADAPAGSCSAATTSPGVDPIQLRRRIGYVIQNVGLFPHQTVRTNVGTVPAAARLGQAAHPRPGSTSCWTSSASTRPCYGDRYPHQLSGGQRQRAGVARALAADPAVLLMDEPFSAVDPVVRERLQSEFLRLQETVRKTIVFVTHDIEEAVRIGDRIAVMSQGGHVEQFATPADLLGRPANAFVADFVGADRGLKRLAVTGIDTADLERPPVVHVRRRPGRRPGRDGAGRRPLGRRPRRRREPARLAVGRAGHRRRARSARAARRMEAWVPVDASLKTRVRRRCCSRRPAGWRCWTATGSSASSRPSPCTPPCAARSRAPSPRPPARAHA